MSKYNTLTQRVKFIVDVCGIVVIQQTVQQLQIIIVLLVFSIIEEEIFIIIFITKDELLSITMKFNRFSPQRFHIIRMIVFQLQPLFDIIVVVVTMMSIMIHIIIVSECVAHHGGINIIELLIDICLFQRRRHRGRTAIIVATISAGGVCDGRHCARFRLANETVVQVALPRCSLCRRCLTAICRFVFLNGVFKSHIKCKIYFFVRTAIKNRILSLFVSYH